MAESPFPIRWSAEAWDGAYGPPWTPHWRPWPWEPEGFVNTYVPPKPIDGAEVLRNIVEFYRNLPKSVPLLPLPDLRLYTCPGCGKPRYLGGWCEWCAHADLVHDQRKPVTISVIAPPSL